VKGNGNPISLTVKPLAFTLRTLIIPVISRMGLEMERVCTHGIISILMMVNEKIIKNLEQAFSITTTVHPMKDNGSMTSTMEKVFSNFWMVKNMKAGLRMVSMKVKEIIFASFTLLRGNMRRERRVGKVY